MRPSQKYIVWHKLDCIVHHLYAGMSHLSEFQKWLILFISNFWLAHDPLLAILGYKCQSTKTIKLSDAGDRIREHLAVLVELPEHGP